MSDRYEDMEEMSSLGFGEYQGVPPKGNGRADEAKSDAYYKLAIALRAALDVLSERGLVYMTGIFSFALFGYTALYPDTKRIIASSLFSIIAWIAISLRRHE